eukprot:752267-Hanusia_phi.AAC.3
MYNRGNRGAAGGAAAATSEDQLESQNEMMLGNLHSRISNLKNITIAIGDEVREQNKALEMMQNGMMSTDNLIGSTLNKMQVMSLRNAPCHFSLIFVLFHQDDVQESWFNVHRILSHEDGLLRVRLVQEKGFGQPKAECFDSNFILCDTWNLFALVVRTVHVG